MILLVKRTIGILVFLFVVSQALTVGTCGPLEDTPSGGIRVAPRQIGYYRYIRYGTFCQGGILFSIE